MIISILDDVIFSEEQLKRLKLFSTSLNIFSNTTNDETEILFRCKDADIIVLGWTKIPNCILDNLPKLKYISIWATGIDYIDIEYASKKNILVSNIPNYASRSVAEYTMCVMLAISRQIISADAHVRSGKYSWKGFEGVELFNKKLGIVGLGNIGLQISKLGNAFGMNVYAYTKNPTIERESEANVTFISLQELFSNCDFISINIPLTNETKMIINSDILSLMKPSAFIINTSRNEVLDNNFVNQLIIANKIAGAALDDISREDSQVKRNDKILLTPHIAFFTKESMHTKSEVCVDNILSFISGTPKNTVTKS